MKVKAINFLELLMFKLWYHSLTNIGLLKLAIFPLVLNQLTIVLAVLVQRKMAKGRFLRPNLDVLTN